MASKDHESRFSYNLSKPYPFRWFSPVAFVGLVVFAALFSFLNYVTSGFYLINENSSNPNETSHGTGWMVRLPSYFRSNSEAICQSVAIPVGSTIFTNQTALTYTLTSVWDPSTADGTKVFSPSLPYYNNILENCSIWGIEVDIEDYQNLQANQIAFAGIGVSVTSFITCSIYGPKGLQMFNLSQVYDYVPETVPLSGINSFLATNFISRDRDARASLWWGETLLSMYWDFLTNQLRAIAYADNNYYNRTTIVKGGLAYSPRGPPGEGDLADLDFFVVDYRFEIAPMYEWQQPATIWPLVNGNGSYEDGQYTSRLNASGAYPDIWVLSDTLAKSAWSTVLVDLGQVSTKPNVLTNATLLAQWTYQAGSIQIGVNVINPIPGPATQQYEAPGYETGPLHISPSTISAEYLCQIPKRKPIGNLIVTILVADLVLLQSVWQIYKLVVDTFFLNDASGSPQSRAESRNTLFRHSTPGRGGFNRVSDWPDEELRPWTPLVRQS